MSEIWVKIIILRLTISSGAKLLHQDEISAFRPIEPFGYYHNRQSNSYPSGKTFYIYVCIYLWNFLKFSQTDIPIAEPDSEDDDYSISVSAVMQRRASTKGRKKGSTVAVGGGYISPRRASSPLGNVLAIGVGGGGSLSGSGYTAGSGMRGSREAMSASNSFDRRRSSVFTTSSAE